MKLTRIVAATGLLVAAGIGGVAVAGPAAAYPANVRAEAQINSTTFAPGQTVTVNVEKTTPGNLTMQIFSAPQTIGTGTVGANASGSVSGAIPAGYSGQHTIQVTGAGGEIFTFGITISGGGSGTGGGSGSGGGLANTGAAVTGIGILGGVLVAGGVFFVVAGRRRAANQTHSV